MQPPGIGEGWFTLHSTPGDRYHLSRPQRYFA